MEAKVKNGFKVCGHCDKRKRVDQFYRRKRGGYATPCKACHCAIYKACPEKRAIYHRGKRYGMTAAEYDALVLQQGGACAICLKTRRLTVDHCHKTGSVRGLLCPLCNSILGTWNDDPQIALNAHAYLLRG